METLYAALPIIILIILMGVMKVSGDKSSVITLFITAFLALFAFNLSVPDMINSFLYGMLKALIPILFIILMAIYSYNVLLQTKKIEVLKQQFSAISVDKSVQVLLITWGFGGLLEGMAGFGTAVAIPAAILISLGFKPMFSAVVSLIANSGIAVVGVDVAGAFRDHVFSRSPVEGVAEKPVIEFVGGGGVVGGAVSCRSLYRGGNSRYYR